MKKIEREGNLPTCIKFVLRSITKTLGQFSKYTKGIEIWEYPKDKKSFYEDAIKLNLTISPIIAKDDIGKTFVVGLGIPGEPLVDGLTLSQFIRKGCELRFMEVSHKLLEEDYQVLVEIQNARLDNPTDLQHMFHLERMMKKYEMKKD
jgi:hypothetical protein